MIHEEHVARLLVGGEPLQDEGHDAVPVRRFPLAQHDAGRHRLAELGVRDADNRDIEHRWMMADRILDASEIDALVKAANALDLDGVTLGSLHRGHFDDVVRDAWADGVLTDAERVDIVRVAELLGIDRDSLQRALVPRSSQNAKGPESGSETKLLTQGAVIVLTGDMTIERAALEAEIIELGYAVGRNVTKKTALLIAADPYTQSGKAKKARDYGITVLGELEGLALIRGA